jgi:hypothetical protein
MLPPLHQITKIHQEKLSWLVLRAVASAYGGKRMDIVHILPMLTENIPDGRGGDFYCEVNDFYCEVDDF